MSVSAVTHYGGSASDHSMVADRTLVPGSARLQVLNPGASLGLVLPDARLMKTGRAFTVVNVSANAMDIEDASGATLASVAGADGAIIFLIQNTTKAGKWAILAEDIL